MPELAAYLRLQQGEHRHDWAPLGAIEWCSECGATREPPPDEDDEQRPETD